MSVKFFSMPFVFSHELLYMPFTCWMPEKLGTMKTFSLVCCKKGLNVGEEVKNHLLNPNVEEASILLTPENGSSIIFDIDNSEYRDLMKLVL
jgi:hypothetical protein